MRKFWCLLIAILVINGFAFAESNKVDRALQERQKSRNQGDKSGADRVRVIIQTSGDPDAQGVSDALEKAGGRKDQKFETFSGLAGEMSVDEIEKLSRHVGVTRISEDSVVKSHGPTPSCGERPTFRGRTPSFGKPPSPQ